MKRLLLFAVCCAMATPRGWSQVEYVMDNLVVSDCFGQLVDSGDGEEYSSNENLVFTVELESRHSHRSQFPLVGVHRRGL